MSQSVALNHAQPDAADLVAAAGHLGAIIRDRRDERPITTRQYARLVCDWIAGIRLDPSFFETHSLRRTKATPIYRRTGNLRTVQRLGRQSPGDRFRKRALRQRSRFLSRSYRVAGRFGDG